MSIIIEGTQTNRTSLIKETDFGTYELFMGRVWISKQDPAREIQGTNIAILNPYTNELKVIAYIIRKGDTWGFTSQQQASLDEVVFSALRSFGWSEETCEELLQCEGNHTIAT